MMGCKAWASAAAIMVLFGSAPADAPKGELPAEQPPREPAGLAESLARERRNQIPRFVEGLELTASSAYPGWPAARAIDGDAKTSWFSASGDSAARGKRPWLELAFPEPISVERVRLVGNREAPWQSGYSILVAELSLFDGNGRLLARLANESAAGGNDIELTVGAPVAGVRRVRLSSVADQGDVNPYGDIAIGEVQVF